MGSEQFDSIRLQLMCRHAPRASRGNCDQLANWQRAQKAHKTARGGEVFRLRISTLVAFLM